MTTRLQCPRCRRSAFKLASWVRNSWPCPGCGAELTYSRRQRILASMLAFLIAILVMLILQSDGVAWTWWRWIAVWFVTLTTTTALSDRVELAKANVV
jgi:uncharacterized protein (DUF983 family)